MSNDAKAQVKAISGDAPKAVPQVLQLSPSDVHLREARNASHNLYLRHPGVSPQDLDLHPTAWNMLSDTLREGDDVTVFPVNRSWMARFGITSVHAGRVVARLAYALENPPHVAGAPAPVQTDYRVERSRPDELPGFVVIRVRDDFRILNSGGAPFKTEREANNFIQERFFTDTAITRYIP